MNSFPRKPDMIVPPIAWELKCLKFPPENSHVHTRLEYMIQTYKLELKN